MKNLLKLSLLLLSAILFSSYQVIERTGSQSEFSNVTQSYYAPDIIVGPYNMSERSTFFYHLGENNIPGFISVERWAVICNTAKVDFNSSGASCTVTTPKLSADRPFSPVDISVWVNTQSGKKVFVRQVNIINATYTGDPLEEM